MLGVLAFQESLQNQLWIFFVFFDSEADIQASIPILEKLGFVYKGDAVAKLHGRASEEGRHFFSFYEETETLDFVHLHVFTKDHPEAKNQLVFKERLCKNAELLKEYETLKKSFQQSSDSRREYTRKKQEFVQKVLGAAPFV